MVFFLHCHNKTGVGCRRGPQFPNIKISAYRTQQPSETQNVDIEVTNENNQMLNDVSKSKIPLHEMAASRLHI